MHSGTIAQRTEFAVAQQRIPRSAIVSADRRVEISKPSAGSESSVQKQRSLQKACQCAQIADEYRGRDTRVLDLTAITPVVDYFVVTTGTSKRQMRAIADEVSRVFKSQGDQPLGVEGREGGTWILQDFGDIVLHIFTPETRQMYDLEHLWADAERIDWMK
jgi:ribosome-associated protein